jgi:putative PIN family toxin of toxin-antitoxin system
VPSAGDVRAVVDTNVLLSGLFWRGRPHALMEQVRGGTLTLISSPALLAELAEVMNRPKFQLILARSNTDPDQPLGELRGLAEIIDPPPLRRRSAVIPQTTGSWPSQPPHEPISSPAMPISSPSAAMPASRSSIRPKLSPASAD